MGGFLLRSRPRSFDFVPHSLAAVGIFHSLAFPIRPFRLFAPGPRDEIIHALLLIGCPFSVVPLRDRHRLMAERAGNFADWDARFE